MLVAVIIGGLILFAMVGVSWYGAVTLPSDALIPMHFGASYNNFVSKRFGLVMHPVAGIVLYLVLASGGPGGSGNDGSSGTPTYVILPFIMCVVLVMQIGAIVVARRKSGV